MTTNPKATRYHTRRVERPAPQGEAGSGLPFDTGGAGFGNLDFRRPEDRAAAERDALLRDGAPQP